MIGFCIFKNIYYNVDIAYQNKILGNIFNLDNVSVSGVIVDNKKIVFKIFCCGIFYQYIFIIGRGIHNIKYMDRIVQLTTFILSDNAIEINMFVYLLFQCRDEKEVYRLMRTLL